MRAIIVITYHAVLLNLFVTVSGFGGYIAAKECTQRLSCSVSRSSATDNIDSVKDEMKLPSELEQLCKLFAMMRGEKERYMKLLQLANTLAPVDESVLVPENVVPGCLSTVHVDCSVSDDEVKQDKVIHFVGESDGLLTKGLLALLVKGLSGCTIEEIEAVDPTFIRLAKIDQSLTPSRNNGFLNMLGVMKAKARKAVSEAKSTTTTELKPMYNAILSKLTTSLQPSEIELIDNSHEHAGHAGFDNNSTESHFKLYIVSHLFEGIPLVKRHQVIYALLPDVMKQIHALQIQAKAPSEL